MARFLSNLGEAGIILNIAIMLASGFLLTRITKRLRLPDVTGYIISGVIIGPWCLKLIAPDFIEQMDFVTDLALAFIAFGVGKYFTKIIQYFSACAWCIIRNSVKLCNPQRTQQRPQPRPCLCLHHGRGGNLFLHGCIPALSLYGHRYCLY